MLSLEPRFGLGSGFSLAAFDKLRSTRVVASRLPRTRKSEGNRVACCSSYFRSNILGELVASTSRRPSTFAFIFLDKEPIDTRVHQLVHGRPNFQSTRDATHALPTLIAEVFLYSGKKWRRVPGSESPSAYSYGSSKVMARNKSRARRGKPGDEARSPQPLFGAGCGTLVCDITIGMRKQ